MSIRKIPIAVRTHTVIPKPEVEKPKFKSKKEDLRLPYGTRVMVFDTETTIDIYQNLTFGRAVIWENPNHVGQAYDNPVLKETYIFYGEGLTSEQLQTLQVFALNEGATLLSNEYFIYKVFFPEVWELGSLCVGFNLPFDLSRIASSVKTFSRGKHKNEFEFRLCSSKYYPTLIVTPIDSKKAFFRFKFPTHPGTQSKRKPFRQGRFLDLRTLTFALTNESHSLDSACRLYQVENGKVQAEEHGVVTPEYIAYNARDVQATFELYCKVKAEFDTHGLTREGSPLEAGRIYSPASMGKAYMQEMNILPFSENCPEFPQEVLGYAMASYYGGRSECHYRGSSIKAYHTDVTSMYPSVFTLQNLWSWVIADGFTVKEDTGNIRALVEEFTLETLFKMETWLQVPALVQVIPNHDLLPVRAEYAQNAGKQIGLNYLTTEIPMWYTLADILAAKILTGKVPTIVKALRVIPGPPQTGLKPVKLKGQIEINPAKDNFFKKVIELRQEVKRKITTSGDSADAMQLFLKILANSTSYGVYVELNREEEEDNLDIEIYSLGQFEVKIDKVEIAGKYYNPLIATMITGGARLILAMMEQSIAEEGGSYAFCDTDSMSVIDLVNNHPEAIGKRVTDRFRSLYPYHDTHSKKSLLAAEDYNWKRKDWGKDTDKQNVNEGEYYPLYCYMVSAKRYVLYNLIPDDNGTLHPILRKKSDHGLGHLRNPRQGKHNDWVSTVWERIIAKEHDLPFKTPVWFSEPAVAQLSVSKPEIFKTLNRELGVAYEKTVKPFNFMVIGYHVQSNFLTHNEQIQSFYCQELKLIGYGGCTNKAKCHYRGSCLANLNKVAISPYSKAGDISSLLWLEKNTKQPLLVGVSTSKPVKDDLLDDFELKPLSENKSFALKNYWDFIKDYHQHPEVKYDDNTGERCKSDSYGLLQRTEIFPKVIKCIGKESNTLQDEEERIALPDELNIFENQLEYENQTTHPKKLYLDEWLQLLPIFKEAAKPRQEWADTLGVSRRYLQNLFSGDEMPSEKLFEQIISIGKKGKWSGIRKIEKFQPKPHAFNQENKGHVLRLEPILNKFPDKDTKRKELTELIFELYGIEYINLKNKEIRDKIKYWNKKNDAITKNIITEKRKEFEKNPVIIGSSMDTHNFLVEIPYSSIVAIRAFRPKGISFWILIVQIKEGTEFKVLQKNNVLPVRWGYLPKASDLVKEYLVIKNKLDNTTEWIPLKKEGKENE